MKPLFLICLLLASLAHAQEQLCRSQLLKVTVASNAITGVTGRSALHFLRNLAPGLQDLLKQDYNIEPIPFPATAEECQRLGVNCPTNFCQDSSVSLELKKQLCFALPCPMIEGTRNVGKCDDVADVYGSTISFPSPVSIKRLKWEVKSIDTVGKEARICFRINDLALSLSTKFEFDTSETSLPESSLTVSNISGELDQPKDICVSASIDLSSNRPIRNVKIIPQSTGPFISDQVIRAAARNVRVTGLSGYNQRELDQVVPELLPVIVHPLRQTLELSIAQALSTVLEDQVATYLNQIDDNSLQINSEAVMSELSYTPAELYTNIAFHECRTLVLSGKPIPAGHACIGQEVTFFERGGQTNITNDTIKITSDSRFFYEVSTMHADMISPVSRWGNIVSERFRKALLNLQKMLESNDLSSDLTAEEGRKVLQGRRRLIDGTIKPFITSIETKRMTDAIFKNVEIQGDLSPGVQREIGLAIPGICSQTSPSSFEDASIPNCPIQAFVDLNQFNRVLTTLWEKGRICDGGQGAVVPNSDAYPNGCVLPTNVIYCKLNAAPQLKYLGASGRYSTNIQLRNCTKNILPFGLFGATFGGDFNATLTFKPKACHNGDFCIDQPQVTWNLVRGSAEGWLKDPAMRGQVTKAIDKAINEAMSKSFRIPFGSATSGLMSEIPLKAEGRTKTGAGYFGVCLKEDRR